MASQNDLTRSFQVNAAMSRGFVVALSPNGKLSLALCDSGTAIGVVQEDATANSYENPKVRLFGAGTVMVAVTGVPLTAGDVMVVVTGGYVSVTNGRAGNTGQKVGILLESAATAAELKEMIMGVGVVT
jgi:hypothetical protein